jgi:hypothetical protein
MHKALLVVGAAVFAFAELVGAQTPKWMTDNNPLVTPMALSDVARARLHEAILGSNPYVISEPKKRPQAPADTLCAKGDIAAGLKGNTCSPAKFRACGNSCFSLDIDREVYGANGSVIDSALRNPCSVLKSAHRTGAADVHPNFFFLTFRFAFEALGCAEKANVGATKIDYDGQTLTILYGERASANIKSSFTSTTTV